MNTSSKSVSSQMQHLQHNFKVKYWFKIKLHVIMKTFKFQNGSTRKLTYKQSLSLNVRPWVLKSPQSQSLDVVVEFNFDWITLAVKQILGNTKKPVWVIKEENIQTFIFCPIFASIHAQKWTSVKHDLFRCLAHGQKSPPQRRNRLLIFSSKSWFGKKFVGKTAYL